MRNKSIKAMYYISIACFLIVLGIVIFGIATSSSGFSLVPSLCALSGCLFSIAILKYVNRS